jgi:hypothetical protein
MCCLLPKGPNKLNAQSSFFPAMRQQLSADRETLEDCLATIHKVSPTVCDIQPVDADRLREWRARVAQIIQRVRT